MKKFFIEAEYPDWASEKSWKSVPFKSIKTAHNTFKLPSFGVIIGFKLKKPKDSPKIACLIEEANATFKNGCR
ncbi:hypothetical protein AB9T89_21015 [Flavobacterium oncorhynchi]|uniref:hypothetical protein n=1 Tax=Flavobacterium oncorhynchi TaxID=728056 RepID=UPI00351A71F4